MTVLATFTTVGITREEAVEDSENPRSNLERVPCIRYPINFRKKSVLVLFDLESEVNTAHPAFAKELGLPIRPTDVEAQKIENITLDIYRIVVAAFLITNKAYQVKFFKKTFLVANVSSEVVLQYFSSF